ncbi:MAG TPA: HAMP domain-containing sensor histidine kinase [Anaeromyxobacteraceae bacterium]|nr:HAMP domain-containing sensor histidine kinase [Anaeromyxobacteraceae bacterium]
METRKPHQYGRSLVRRYSLLLLAAAAVPMVIVGALYDRYARSLLDEFTGEQLNARLAATSSRLGSFLDERAYQLETLARYPSLSALDGAGAGKGEEVSSLLRVGADAQDLYGILFFSEGRQLTRAVAGAAASGPPYWPEVPFEPGALPRRRYREAELVGPAPPTRGQSGWFMLEEPLPAGGSIALHVRLASLTELLGAPSAAGVLQPVLRTPAGDFDAVGRPAAIQGRVMEGPEVAPGWRPLLLVDPAELLRPFDAARYSLVVASLVMLCAIGWLLTRLASRLGRRVDLLAHGAEVVSAGDFSHRVPDASDDELGFLAVAFNRMASKLGTLVDRAVRIERLAVLGKFSTGVAHEVRNPLATLKTTVQALGRSESDPQKLALLEDMEQEIDRMARAMEDLLAFGRPSPPRRQEVQVREVARRLHALVAEEAERRQVEFRVKVAPDLLAVVDPDHLQQILMNLALNALQATPAGGVVTLDAYPAGPQVTIEVTDTGTGIPAEALRHVFDPFFTTKRGGTGLGLSISRQLAEMNDGRLTLESVPLSGATARVTLVRSETSHGGHPDR